MRFTKRTSCLFALMLLAPAAAARAALYTLDGPEPGTAIAGTVTVANGNGVNPVQYQGLDEPLIGSAFRSQITIASHTYVTVVAYGVASQRPLVIPGFEGELLMALGAPIVFDIGQAMGDSGLHTLQIPKLRSLVGAKLRCQGLRIQSTQIDLLNALDLEIGAP